MTVLVIQPCATTVVRCGRAGIDGVSVLLCRDTDGTAGPSSGDTLVSTTTTATLAGNAGKYSFNDLLAGNN